MINKTVYQKFNVEIDVIVRIDIEFKNVKECLIVVHFVPIVGTFLHQNIIRNNRRISYKTVEKSSTNEYKKCIIITIVNIKRLLKLPQKCFDLICITSSRSLEISNLPLLL